MQKLILASGSARRREIMELMGYEFEVHESGYDEEQIKTDDIVELVEELARQKASAVADHYPDAVIIGGDTMVVVDDQLLGKAENKNDAAEMMRKLSGRTHRVVSGVAVINTLTREQHVGHESGEITFREITPEEIERYVSDERNWRGFAGSYAMQGAASPFVVEQTGVKSAIIGMPIALTQELLEMAGVEAEIDVQQLEHELDDKKVGL